MITSELTNELKRRLAWILTSYGGLNNFISYLKESLYIEPDISYRTIPKYQQLALFNHIKLLLQFQEQILLISPWNLFIDLREQNNSLDIINNSINIEEPYKLYTIDGSLLYTVKKHLGVFGESKLDKNLILNSVNTSIYFLKYTLYNGEEQVKLVLVNLHSKNSIISNINFRNNDDNLISNLTVVNNSGAVLNLYKTDSPYINNPNINSFNNIDNLHSIKNNDAKSFNISSSCYLYTNNVVNITHTKITYPLNNIVFINNNSSPIFVGANIDPSFLNKTFNRSIQFSNKPLNDIITYTSI